MNQGPRSEPCSACPYRLDVPSGVWHPSEYDKLREYDAPTGDQPFSAFACHATPTHLCRGWAEVHSNRGGAYELLALRLEQRGPVYDRTVPMFDSGADAADWGQQDADDPSVDARLVIERLMRKYPRIQTREEP